MIKLPNFLLVGSAKCGTTSMSEYLKQHPQIFLSKIKEPRFFSNQSHQPPLGGPGDTKRENRYIKNYSDYQALFQEADGYHAIGEASADTLYFYQKTIPAIKQYVGDQPKIIIMLRDPVKRAFSAYQHLIRDQRETATFEEGLRNEDERIQNNYELIWHYRGVSRYYEAVNAFLQNFDQIHIIINEDIRKDEKEVFRKVFDFLEVDPNFIVDTSIRYNSSGVPHSKWLHNFLFEENWLKRSIRPITHRLTSHKFRQQTSNNMLTRNLQRMEISPDVANTLRAEFQEEKKKLEELLG